MIVGRDTPKYLQDKVSGPHHAADHTLFDFNPLLSIQVDMSLLSCDSSITKLSGILMCVSTSFLTHCLGI